MKLTTNFAALGSLLLAASANAALVNVATTAYDVADIVTAGTQIFALNADAVAGTSSEGGVTWTSFTTASTLPTGLTIFAGTGTDDAGNGTAGTLTTERVFGGASDVISISGLADGNYVIQLMMSDSRALGGTNNLTADFDNDGIDATVAVTGTGGLVTAEFSITGGATQDIVLRQATGVGNFAGGVSAIQLRTAAVPEPSSTALLGLGGLTLILRRRK